MGTGPFAVPTFRELYWTDHDIVALVTSPLRSHRGKEFPPVNLVRDLAHEHTTLIFDPENINTAESQIQLSRFNADLLVVCDYGQILSASTLATAQIGRHQSPCFVAAEISGRRADQLGDLQRRI